MASKPVVKIDAITKLGVEKLAALVAGEAERNPGFRKLLKAALAGVKGPEAVAKLVDTRLASLERAQSTISWRRARSFAQDLDTIRVMIVDQLAPLSPTIGADRLLRFIASHESVFDRLNDSGDKVSTIYLEAIETLAELAAKLPAEDRLRLPERIMARLSDDGYGYLLQIVKAVAPRLQAEALLDWDQRLAPKSPAVAKREGVAAWESDRRLLMRQLLARARGDLDALVALEAMKSPASQDGFTMAQLLFDAGRFAEALDWLRKPRETGIRFVRRQDLADMAPAPPHPESIVRAQLEARILTALGDKPAAQALRWARFEAELDPAILRDYIAALGDFEEFEALDRAFAHAFNVKPPELGLAFLVVWPRLDKAAEMVLAKGRRWDGRNFDLLAPAADALAEEHPLAATVLFRALVDDILARSRSQVYDQAAIFLAVLDALKDRLDADALAATGMPPHRAYMAQLRKVHGRKYGFWSLVPSDL
ncbi:hypothetical protein BTR14_06170 [Rhizobium rhizosphaerae]|uniref:Uncharacterized protein n=1 Tax=Xaviernesmea rhizosphaerae TaxID=1672749 RepID=A0ABX3PGK4_9HYPH|nr:DUF6880 family protein [Xaviernesmea rhizosphaerae]OQP87507.1 hypothetical protein BTR14_06170 [Xaviernesmea rhizosphaerae]